ncbi:sigma-70 family RNA polymerase sigma factor [Proteinivorax hydrogeniformans]|uniref:Sigma-70 family RNA polymerase sigma factor n=1 Tax=Proteinivorax hydrogeniformans TaxID=1826727 RepID=A0AAU8HQN8_9FIRM
MEKDALEKVYKKYYKELYFYVLSLCNDHDLANDLVSDTFYKAFLTLDKPDDSLKFWLFRVAKNLFIDLKRKKEEQNSSIDDYAPFIVGDNSPLKTILANERDLRLYEKSDPNSKNI